MIRRLAAFSRDDQVTSTRDYQTITQRLSDRLDCSGPGLSHAKMEITLSSGDTGIGGFGLFYRSSNSGDIRITLTSDHDETSQTLHSVPYWTKAGIAVSTAGSATLTALLEINNHIGSLDIWGCISSSVDLPDVIAESETILDDLRKVSLCPESLYFDHEGRGSYFATNAELDNCSVLHGGGIEINVKKCAYCQRQLPIDPSRPGALSFHKHNAKKTGHQNECRACKKWRINDTLNPRRTADQLHESSVITREKKLFLQEPVILQQIKDRHGAGLRSIIWKRFNKCCFKCKKQVGLKEFQLDHTRPLAYLWPIDMHATCLCSTCNNHKGDRFPIEFYSPSELQELSLLCGLPLRDLSAREVNPEQLDRILNDLCKYAISWDASTFQSVARRVNELHSEIDIYHILSQEDSAVFDVLQSKMQARPEKEPQD